MTLRFLPLAVAALAFAGCEGSGSSAGTADLDGIADASAFEQVSYNVGYQSAQQFLAQDSSFNFDRFVDGFNAGLRGDSAEIGYALGLQYGLQVGQDTLGTIDRDLFLAGVRSGLAGEEARLTPEQFQAAQAIVEDSIAVRTLRAQARTDRMAQQRLDLMTRNATSSDSFLTAVRGRPGVQELGEGVLYTVETPGEGASPGPNDRVAIRYRGQFANGEVFDESGDEPTVLAVNQVVPGFRDALLDMSPGETRTVYLPPSQAYGLMGSPGPGGQGGIPPNAALQFELTLVEILDMQPPPGTFVPGAPPQPSR
ncbi:FKBP-type peptidyl-prolyl cis-trans isomerase [Rubrivirga sp.]|uniref:FKBP-type peptidyl-prolyl cis-trans isomerase n=1 Tax=Rubrivirga sp. TaxID=1885344 RepID=UPI003B52C897